MINKTIILLAIIFGAIVFSCLCAYLDFVHDRKVFEAGQAEIRRERLEEGLRAEKLQNCLNKTEALYMQWWKQGCKSRRLPENCNLPNATVENFNQERENFRDTCFRQHSK